MAATGALIVAAVGTAASVDSSKRAARRQKEAQEIQQSQQIAEQREQQRRQSREQRIRRARVLQAAENTGVATSSGAIGATAGLSTALASNIAFGQGQTRSAELIGNQLSQAADARQNAQTAGAVASFAGTVFNSAGGWNKTIFSG